MEGTGAKFIPAVTMEPGAELLQAGAGRGVQAVSQSRDVPYSGPDA